jgi:Skp family chaperone for outer membrane proteins
MTAVWRRAGVAAGLMMLLAVAPVAAQAPGATATRVGFVDVQRVLARSAAGVSAREQLEREKAVMQK